MTYSVTGLRIRKKTVLRVDQKYRWSVVISYRIDME